MWHDKSLIISTRYSNTIMIFTQMNLYIQWRAPRPCQGWGVMAGWLLWTVCGPVRCATRTLSAARATASCASAWWERTGPPCWPTVSARLLWRCCRTIPYMTAAASVAWRKNCSAYRTTGASTWAWQKVRQGQEESYLIQIHLDWLSGESVLNPT